MCSRWRFRAILSSNGLLFSDTRGLWSEAINGKKNDKGPEINIKDATSVIMCIQTHLRIKDILCNFRLGLPISLQFKSNATSAMQREEAIHRLNGSSIIFPV